MARLRTDPDSIEQIAREELGLVKPGERVLKLPPSREAGEPAWSSSSLLFFVALFLNVRASFKLGARLEGDADHRCASCATPMRALDALPSEEALEREPRAPVFLHLVPAYQEPDIAGTVKAL